MRIRSSHFFFFGCLLFALCLSVAPPLFAQDNQDTGVITLVSKVVWEGGVVLDLWGYVDETTGREYALVGRFAPDALSIVDTTDPANPFEVTTLVGVGGFDIKTWQHYAYTVGDDNTGDIIDLSDPADPQVVGHFPSSHNIFIDDRGHLYLEGPGLRILDLIADPSSPVLLWQDEGNGGHDAAVIGETLYDFHGGETNIYDVADPANPRLLGTIAPPTIRFHHSGWPSKDGTYLFLCDELAYSLAQDLTVWDISQPDSPRQVAAFNDPASPIHNLYVIGDYAFVSHYTAGFRVFDVSDPASPHIIGTYGTTALVGDSFSGAFGAYPFTKSGHVYVSNMEGLSASPSSKGTLFIFAVEGITPATPTNTETPPDLPRTTTLHANYPNPFNPQTRIAYTLDAPASVQLYLFDVQGRRVRTLVDRPQAAGTHAVSWDGRDEAGRVLPSGAYLYRLETGDVQQTRLLHLLK